MIQILIVGITVFVLAELYKDNKDKIHEYLGNMSKGLNTTLKGLHSR